MKLNEIREKYPELAKTTVSDILKTKEYSANFTDAIIQYDNFIKSITNNGQHKLKRSPMDRLKELGLFENAEVFANEYSAVLDKYSKLPRVLRDFIKNFGSTVYTKTVKDLMEKYDKNREISSNEK